MPDPPGPKSRGQRQIPPAGTRVCLADDFDAVIIAIEDVSEQNALTMALGKMGREARVTDSLSSAMMTQDQSRVGLVITDDWEFIAPMNVNVARPNLRFC